MQRKLLLSIVLVTALICAAGCGKSVETESPFVDVEEEIVVAIPTENENSNIESLMGDEETAEDEVIEATQSMEEVDGTAIEKYQGDIKGVYTEATLPDDSWGLVPITYRGFYGRNDVIWVTEEAEEYRDFFRNHDIVGDYEMPELLVYAIDAYAYISGYSTFEFIDADQVMDEMDFMVGLRVLVKLDDDYFQGMWHYAESDWDDHFGAILMPVKGNQSAVIEPFRKYGLNSNLSREASDGTEDDGGKKEDIEVKELTFSEFEEMVRNNTTYGEYYSIFDTSGMEYDLNCQGKVFRAKTSSDVEYNSVYYVSYCIFNNIQEAKEACERLYERREQLDSKVSGTESCFITLNDNSSSYLVTRKGNIVMVGYAVDFQNIYSGCGNIMGVFGFETATLE